MFGKKKGITKKKGLSRTKLRTAPAAATDNSDDTEIDLEPISTTLTSQKTGLPAPSFSSGSPAKPDPIYNFFLIASALIFISVIILAGIEANKFYDVAFFFFKKS